MITLEDFQKIDIRVGTIQDIQDFPEARKPAYKLWIDLGELGIKKSSAQITTHYTKEALLGKQILCVTNFPPRQVGPFMSEVLTLGLIQEDDSVILIHPERSVKNGLLLA